MVYKLLLAARFTISDHHFRTPMTQVRLIVPVALAAPIPAFGSRPIATAARTRLAMTPILKCFVASPAATMAWNWTRAAFRTAAFASHKV